MTGATTPAVRALIVTPDFPPAHGGIQVLMGELAARLPVTAVRVVTFAGDPSTADADDVVRVRRLAGRRRVRMLSLGARAVVEARRFGADVVLVGHVAVSPAVALLRRALGVPVVTYVHADEFDAWPRRCTFAMRTSDAVIAVSRHAEAMALRNGALPARVHRILHGVEMPAPGAGIPPRAQEPLTILTIARMTHLYKGHDVLIEALPAVRRSVPRARWVVVGDGPLRAGYEARVRRLGLESAVHFTGEVDIPTREDWLRRAHVFAMPSRTTPDGVGGEGFGLVYLEAAAHGLPVIAARDGGAVDAVDPGRSAILLDPTDPTAVAEALAALLTDPDRADAMGRAGVAWARRFPWQRTADAVAAVLRDTVRDARR